MGSGSNGNIIRGPWRRHGRASSTTGLFTSARDSTVIPATPRSVARRLKDSQCPAGMPRVRQHVTVDFDSDSASDTALVPPRALITESGVSMESTVVCTMQTCQEFASSETTFDTGCDAIPAMIDPPELIVGRLEKLREELGFPTAEKFAVEIGLTKGAYSGIVNFHRELSFETACRIKDKYKISLDWLFYGDFQQSAVQIMTKIGQGPGATPVKPAKPQKTSKRKAG